jgi:predicted amidohydrolase
VTDRYLAAVVQLGSGADRTANLDAAAALVGQAASQGAALVVLPEVVAWRGPRDEEAAHVEAIPGPTADAMAALARTHRLVLCAGSWLERSPEPDLAYNTTCVFGPDGTLLARYRKIHLFDVAIPERVAVQESATRLAGDEVVTVATPLGTLGLSICYDLRFPELYRRLAHAGAEVLLVPSAFTAPTGEAHWDVLLRARAIENQCYVLAANQTGRSPHGFADYGNSLVVDPWGVVLARAADGPGIALAEIDRARLSRIRRELPSLANTRLR